MEKRILRVKEVMASSSLTHSTLYRYISRGLWTKPIKLTDRTSGWPADEVNLLIKARIAGNSNEDMEILVKELELARKMGKLGE